MLGVRRMLPKSKHCARSRARQDPRANASVRRRNLQAAARPLATEARETEIPATDIRPRYLYTPKPSEGWSKGEPDARLSTLGPGRREPRLPIGSDRERQGITSTSDGCNMSDNTHHHGGGVAVISVRGRCLTRSRPPATVLCGRGTDSESPPMTAQPELAADQRMEASLRL